MRVGLQWCAYGWLGWSGPPVSAVSSFSPRHLFSCVSVRGAWHELRLCEFQEQICRLSGLCAVSESRNYAACMAGLRAGVAGLGGEDRRGPLSGRAQSERDAYRAGMEVCVAGAAEAISAFASSKSDSTVSPASHPSRRSSGGNFLRTG